MSGRAEQAAAWMYHGLWRVLVDWFRVPAEPPTLPVAPNEFIHSFQPGEGFLRYLKFLFWIWLVIIDVALGAAYIVAAVALWQSGYAWVALLLPPALFVIVAPDIIAYIAIHLRYDTTWYVMTERSLRIRRGIWIIHETTITFENVQNLNVNQGPVQRYFGIADLVVETAGAGGGHGGKGGGTTITNQGIVEGIAHAPELRDRILLKLRQSRSAGLGDEDSTAADKGHGLRTSSWSSTHLEALRVIRLETQRLAV